MGNTCLGASMKVRCGEVVRRILGARSSGCLFIYSYKWPLVVSGPVRGRVVELSVIFARGDQSRGQ